MSFEGLNFVIALYNEAGSEKMFGFMCGGIPYWERPDGSRIVIKKGEELPDEVKSDLNDVLGEIDKELKINGYNKDLISLHDLRKVKEE